MPDCLICHTPNPPGTSSCRACGTLLNDAGLNDAGSTPAPSSDVAHALPNGTLLQGDTFRIDGILGQGGFGITYRGRDVRLDREVAIKEFFPFGNAIRIRQDNRLVPSGGLSPGEFEKARDAFLEEARTLARFSHAHIVNVFTIFEEKNTAYMVMEFLSGQSLQARIESKRALSEDEALPVIEQIASALENVHAAGLLHRDLKPDNILLCPDAYSGERVVLLDFGSARNFTAGKTQSLDRLITSGYAPLEQYSSSARFDVYTDIYSLGATLYQCLTGQIPPAAPDRVSGVELIPPRQLNPQLSPAINDATLWALSLKAADRPQSVHEFLTALRLVKDSLNHSFQPATPNNGSGSTSAPPSRSSARDPYAARLEAIAQQLARSVSLPTSRHDAALQETQARLARLAAWRAPQERECPACKHPTLQRIAPAIGASDCPLCEGKLAHRQFDLNLCPICRQQRLSEHSFGEKSLFCPVCRVAPLKEDHRRKLGLIIDIWMCCPHCKAEWDVYSSNNAKMMVAGNDARGQEFLGETKPMSEWKKLAARADRVLRCGGCAAQFDATNDDRVTLVRAPRDPHGIAARYTGKTFFRRAWARLAHGLPLGAGNCACTRCRAEWNFDPTGQTLKLLQCNIADAAWKGQTHGLSEWKFLRAGKSSGRSGAKCGTCTTEFDDSDGLLRLVTTPPGPLATSCGQKFSLPDWHRIAAGLPDSREEGNLRRELQRLEELQSQETAAAREAQNRERQNLEHELDSLARQAFLAGYLDAVDISSMRTQIGEEVRWLSSAVMLRRRTREGIPHWDTDRQGALMVTDSRLVFLHAPGVESWARLLNKLQRVETPSLAGQVMLETHFQGLKNPVGFVISTMSLDVIVVGRSRRLVFTTNDLATWLNAQR